MKLQFIKNLALVIAFMLIIGGFGAFIASEVNRSNKIERTIDAMIMKANNNLNRKNCSVNSYDSKLIATCYSYDTKEHYSSYYGMKYLETITTKFTLDIASGDYKSEVTSITVDNRMNAILRGGK